MSTNSLEFQLGQSMFSICCFKYWYISGSFGWGCGFHRLLSVRVALHNKGPTEIQMWSTFRCTPYANPNPFKIHFNATNMLCNVYILEETVIAFQIIFTVYMWHSYTKGVVQKKVMAGVWTNKAKAVYHQRLSHPASHLLLDLGCQKRHSTQVNIYFLCNKKRQISKS